MKMEGDRILRSILNQTQTSCVVKDVENYLKPIQKPGSKCVDITNWKKYQSFSLKLLRCSIQSFEKGKNGLCHLVDACQFAITYLETACSHFISTKDAGLCQLERLIKLLYHFLVYLSKMEDFDRFTWYSKKTLIFCKLEISLNRNESLKGPEEEVLAICDKIFEMHWKVSSQIANHKSLPLNVLSLRMQGLFFLLSASKDVMKIARYFEVALLTFLQDVKNRNFILEGELASMLGEILQSLMSYLVTGVNDGVNIKASLMYLTLLSFKTAIVHISSKECLDGLLAAKYNNKQNENASTLFLPLIEAYRTHLLLGRLSGNKLCKELCNQSKKIARYLHDFATIHKQLLESKFLLENPKVMTIYDIIRILLSFPEKLCWEIMVQLVKLAVNLKKHIDSLWQLLCDELNNNSGRGILDGKKRKLLCLQWYSFVCWCLQTVETWLGSNGKSIEHTSCLCIAKSQWKKETLFEDCFVLMESASSMLKYMAENRIDFKNTEYNWIGVAAYNLGIVAQKDVQQTRIIALLQLSILNLKEWVKSGDSDVLVRIHQSGIMAKQKVLVGILLKSDLKEKALFAISDYVLFLLSMNISNACLEQARAMIKEQVIFWINTKEKIDHELSNDGVARALSVEIEKISGSTMQSFNLKFIIGCELTELIDRRSPSSIRDSKYLLDFITAKYTGDDDIFVAESIVQCLSLQEYELQERIALCLKAKALLEEALAKPDYPDFCEDLMALSYFSLGCCDQRMKLLKCNKADSEIFDNNENDNKTLNTFPEIPDYISSFDMAMKIWTHLIQNVSQKKSNCKVEETIKFAHKTSQCLFYMGSIYSLHHQHLKSIRAFYLSNLTMTLLDSPVTKGGFDMWITVSFESVRQLLDLFDFSTSIAVLEDVPDQHEFDKHDSIKLQTAKAIVLTKAGEFEKARNTLEALLKSDWINQKTQRSFFQKADTLFALALAKDSPCNSSTDKDHPLVIAQEALKIFRNLANMLFLRKDNTRGREAHRRTNWQVIQDEKEVFPWIVLGRLLDCLLYIVQRYRLQGCIPEARCHIKEALLLCEQFGLNERKLEFLMEEADAGLMSRETEKIESCLCDISTCMRDSFGNDCVISHEDGIDSCSCHLCSYIFLAKSRVRFLLIKRCHALLSPSEVNCLELEDKNITESLLKLERNSNTRLEELRRTLTTGKGKKRKKVTFDDSAKISIESELKDSIRYDFLLNLTTNDICRLVWFEHRIEAHNLNCRSASTCQKSTLLRDIDLVLSDMKKLKFFPLICNSYRTSLARLIQNRVWLFLSSEAGMPAINAAWLPSKAENRPNLEGNINYSEDSKDSSDKQGTKQDAPPHVRKQRASRKGSRVKRKAKKPVIEDVGKNEKKVSLSEQAIEDLKNMCHEALSYLIPNIHCLQIKELYELLSIITGNLCPVQAAYIEALSFARSLNQQLLVRNVKKARNSSKMEEHGDSHNDLSHVTIPMLTEANDTFSFRNHENLKQKVVDDLPKDWRICSIRMSNMGTKCLIVTRFQAYQDPIILRIPINDADDHEDEDVAVGGLVRDLASAFVTDPLDEFDEILEQSLQSLETEDVKAWWNNRKKLDKRLQKMLCKIENAWLGGWKGVLLGDRKDVNYQLKVKETVEKFCKEVKSKYGLELLESTVEVLFDSYSLLDRAQVNKAFKTLLGSQFLESIVKLFVVMAEQFVEVDSEKGPKSQQVIGRRGRQKEVKTDDVKRSPVILVLDKQLQKVPWESIPMLRNQMVSRMPSLLLTRLSFLNSGKFLTNGVCTGSTFYVLNPRNDLQNTQKTFEKWFQSIRGWQGLSGRAPSEAEYRSALEDFDMFIYCGHGNGREYLRGDDIQRINCRALTFLIGCSSGKLLVKGDLDARGMALHYLIAGCPAIIANLWDVTDKDIDRFLSKTLEEWLKKDVNLLECMPMAKDSCLLPYLIGASPVLYGLPVIFKSSSVDIEWK